MNNQCIAYVTDVEYSFPTILSALQARKFASPATDVCVLMSERLDNFDELRALLAASGVELADATDALQDSLGKLDSSHFQGRISVSTMAKLVLCEILPAHYSQIIYLDGDTQIVSDLGKLENATVPEGRFFAARDYTAIQDFLNTGKDNHYFNAGVLKFHRNGWIGQEALALFAKNPEACEGKHDQGALNYVCGSSLILVSNRWNFPKQFLHLVNMSSLAIVHYMAHPKPWHGTFFPWTDRESQVYVDLRNAHPIYSALYRGISLDRKMLYKYRSMRARLEHAIERNGPHPRVQSLLVGDYAV
ncbi:glycosyltransferase family 8 protein [Rhizobium bangladeshense]|uniref:glycosyltransferase family 8 protein n=1 Tax=Rhizobium bangladeshense TaxID=1138189 RepID=UPI001A989906|nr:glycosyltransferase [Rhizobium bangladeshense]MBX4933903.1 glycosyl transferase [Rhizobium bangladeshense]QSY87879.1 glycosyl transferase [Rhizobium bangladeshense]